MDFFHSWYKLWILFSERLQKADNQADFHFNVNVSEETRNNDIRGDVSCFSALYSSARTFRYKDSLIKIFFYSFLENE